MLVENMTISCDSIARTTTRLLPNSETESSAEKTAEFSDAWIASSGILLDTTLNFVRSLPRNMIQNEQTFKVFKL